MGEKLKKTALKLAGAAIAVPILLGGLALPANAAAVPLPGTTAKPAPEVAIGLPTAPVAQLPVKSPAASGAVVTKAAAIAGPGRGVPPSAATKAMTAKEFAAVRKANPWLGKPIGTIQYNLHTGGATKKYKGGSIGGAQGGPAFAMKPSIRNAYLRYGRPGFPFLGYPTSAEVKLAGGGSVQQFHGGEIHWSAKGGAHHVYARGPWEQHGGMTGRLGYPTSDWIKDGTKGFHQNFKGGKVVWTNTAIFDQPILTVVFNKKK